jgi:uncharacterized protein (UPF0335 family)
MVQLLLILNLVFLITIFIIAVIAYGQYREFSERIDTLERENVRLRQEIEELKNASISLKKSVSFLSSSLNIIRSKLRERGLEI